MTFESFIEAQSFFLWATFGLALVLGAVANKTNFCTMGAVSDMVNMGDLGRFRAWLLAIAVAVIGVVILEYFGKVAPGDAFPPYRNGNLNWAENLLGGLMFGIGMTLASGCGNKTLIRIGGGNLKSVLVFIIIALIAWYMINPFPGSDKTLFSVLFYDWIRPMSADLAGQQDIGAVISAVGGTTPRKRSSPSATGTAASKPASALRPSGSRTTMSRRRRPSKTLPTLRPARTASATAAGCSVGPVRY